MKRDAFLLIGIILCVILNQFVSAIVVEGPPATGNTIADPLTGKLTSQQVAMSIFVQTITPYIELISPKNQTYLKNESLILNYTVSDGDYVWYNLDNTGNITINSPVYFNTSEGSHTLYIFSNKSENITTKNIAFTANSSRFIILSENYVGSNKGASTEFSNYTYEELQSLNNLTLENTNYGKIKFNEAINVTDDKNNADNIVDIDSNIIISNNHIELNSTNLSNFNKSATLWLYNLTFTNPRILKDGIVCPSTICTKEGYTFPSGAGENGILKFNVTGFSAYSVEETPVTNQTVNLTITTRGGGGVTIKEKKFEISPGEMLISLKQGETTSKKIIITNLENQRLKVELNNTFLKDFIRFNETEFYLNPKESKEINVDFIVSDDIPPNLYLGKIIATIEGTQKEILAAIEVESKSSLFDIKMSIPTKFQYVLPGEDILAQVELYNLGSQGRTDVLLDYIIKDNEGNEIIQEHDTVAVETSMSFIKDIKIPENLAFGKYVFYVRVNYNDKIASASAWFNVGKKEIDKSTIFLYILVVVLIIIILIAILEIRKIKKYLKPKYKVDENLLIKEGLIKIKK
jgi:hypothetical protein